MRCRQVSSSGVTDSLVAALTAAVSQVVHGHASAHMQKSALTDFDVPSTASWADSTGSQAPSGTHFVEALLAALLEASHSPSSCQQMTQAGLLPALAALLGTLGLQAALSPTAVELLWNVLERDPRALEAAAGQAVQHPGPSRHSTDPSSAEGAAQQEAPASPGASSSSLQLQAPEEPDFLAEEQGDSTEAAASAAHKPGAEEGSASDSATPLFVGALTAAAVPAAIDAAVAEALQRYDEGVATAARAHGAEDGSGSAGVPTRQPGGGPHTSHYEGLEVAPGSAPERISAVYPSRQAQSSSLLLLGRVKSGAGRLVRLGVQGCHVESFQGLGLDLLLRPRPSWSWCSS